MPRQAILGGAIWVFGDTAAGRSGLRPGIGAGVMTGSPSGRAHGPSPDPWDGHARNRAG